jgi:hypothetical protein
MVLYKQMAQGYKFIQEERPPLRGLPAENCGEYNPKRFTGPSNQEEFESMINHDSKLTASKEAEAYRGSFLWRVFCDKAITIMSTSLGDIRSNTPCTQNLSLCCVRF